MLFLAVLSCFVVLFLVASEAQQTTSTISLRGASYVEIIYYDEDKTVGQVYGTQPVFAQPIVDNLDELDIKFGKVDQNGQIPLPNVFRANLYDSISGITLPPFPALPATLCGNPAVDGVIKCVPTKSGFKLVLVKLAEIPSGYYEFASQETPYQEVLVTRSTTYVYNEFRDVYALVTPKDSTTGSVRIYVMQSYRTNKNTLESLPTLGQRLEGLPKGWTYVRVKIPPQKRLLSTTVGAAVVLLDSEGSTYQYLDPANIDPTDPTNVAGLIYLSANALSSTAASIESSESDSSESGESSDSSESGESRRLQTLELIPEGNGAKSLRGSA